MPVEMERDEFERVVGQALDEIPGELTRRVRNLVVLIEDEAPAHDPHLLGLYEGVALTSPGSDTDPYGPARIFIFRHNLQQMCATVEELRDEIRITVLHEVAHHFGIDDERLHDLGYA